MKVPPCIFVRYIYIPRLWTVRVRVCAPSSYLARRVCPAPRQSIVVRPRACSTRCVAFLFAQRPDKEPKTVHGSRHFSKFRYQLLFCCFFFSKFNFNTVTLYSYCTISRRFVFTIIIRDRHSPTRQVQGKRRKFEVNIVSFSCYSNISIRSVIFKPHTFNGSYLNV